MNQELTSHALGRPLVSWQALLHIQHAASGERTWNDVIAVVVNV